MAPGAGTRLSWTQSMAASCASSSMPRFITNQNVSVSAVGPARLDEIESGNRREGAFVGVYNSAFKTGYLLAPTLAMVLLSITGFDGALAQQSEETKALMRTCLFWGCLVTFAGALAMSLMVRLTKKEVEAAQAALAT